MISVFGSINVDLVCRVTSIARPGETVLSPGYEQFFGGKGANQAVAAARAGATVEMIGTVGADGHGDLARANLERNGVRVDSVSTSDLPTGCAFIVVSENGENAITVASGANMAVDPVRLQPASILVAQMELPAEVTLRQIQAARRSGATTILNFAPVPHYISEATLIDLLRSTDVLVVNEHELIALCEALNLKQDAAVLASRAQCHLIITRGADGIILFGPEKATEPFIAGAPVIDAIDTTGAGDTFVGVLAAGLEVGLSLPKASHRAMFAASLACRSSGAQSAMPTLTELHSFMADL